MRRGFPCIEWKATRRTIVVSNERPLRAADVPFVRSEAAITPVVADDQLLSTLLAERNGILAWLARGAEYWLE